MHYPASLLPYRISPSAYFYTHAAHCFQLFCILDLLPHLPMTSSLRLHFFHPALPVTVNSNMPNLYQLSLKSCSSHTLIITCSTLLPPPVSNLAITFPSHFRFPVLHTAILSTTLSISLSYAFTWATASPLTDVSLFSKSARPDFVFSNLPPSTFLQIFLVHATPHLIP
jgi:hypothetical protein